MGALGLRVFDQGIWWVDVQQRPHRIAEMPADYVANVIGHLEGNAEYFYVATLRRIVIEDATNLLLGRLPVNAVAEGLGAPSLADVAPHAWLASTPLLRALHRHCAS